MLPSRRLPLEPEPLWQLLSQDSPKSREEEEKGQLGGSLTVQPLLRQVRNLHYPCHRSIMFSTLMSSLPVRGLWLWLRAGKETSFVALVDFSCCKFFPPTPILTPCPILSQQCACGWIWGWKEMLPTGSHELVWAAVWLLTPKGKEAAFSPALPHGPAVWSLLSWTHTGSIFVVCSKD